MCPEPDEVNASGPDEPKECPVCDQEFNGVCPQRSSDCPFAYDTPPKDLNLEDEEDDSSLLPDVGLDDDFDVGEDEEDDDDLFVDDKDD